MIQLRNYQTESVNSLLIKTNKLLESSGNKICVFQAPTGSGKTIMVAELIKKLVVNRKDNKEFSFIWISVRKLHDQSKDKLERYYEDNRLLKCSYFDDLENKKIDKNEILFINWHSINKKDINIYIKENEQDNNLNTIIQNTKDEGREIILIIDESHHTAGSEKSKELINVISPKITLEVSATPQLKDTLSEIEIIDLDKVKAEEMIKSEIIVNPEFMNLKVRPESTDELIIGQSLKKREELRTLYKKEKTNINPLVLIQLPDKKQGLETKKDEVIKILNHKFKISEDNGKLAIWLSEDKSDTLPNIEKTDNEVEVLVFKQAPALGWDCPRASILVIFRESTSLIFTIQTIGRIMRMPELKYYNEQELNKGYIFTNLADIELAEDYVKDYVSIYESKRNNLYNKISLHSIYLKRQRERTRLSGKFSEIFQKVADRIGLKTKVKIKDITAKSSIISEGKIKDIDKHGFITHSRIDWQIKNNELQNRFNEFIRDNCTPYAPVDSSDRMKTAIYNYFKKEFNIPKYDSRVHNIILNKNNIQVFIDTINLAKEKYKKEVIAKISQKRDVEKIEQWEVPVIINHNSRYQKTDHPLSVMSPLYLRDPSKPEQEFLEFLNNPNKIKWFYKNGESEIKYFAIPYIDENGMAVSFYVDFIVMFKDNSIGLFDTKGGITAKDASPKSEGLQKYIKEQNKKGKKLWGGIIIKEKGTWRYNDEEKYNYNPNDLSNWKILEF